MVEQKVYSILVMDDQEDIRDMITFQLKAVGYVVKAVSNGIEALKCLQTFTPDVIILDISMPKMDGFTFYQKICDKNDKPKYPIIVHTGRIELAPFFLDFYVDGFLSKPADINKILKEVDLVIKRKTREVDPSTGKKNIKSIFIVEDDKNDYLELLSVFKNSGYHIENSNSGVDAILRMLESPPDVVLTKLGIKDIPGDVLALRLKTLARTSDARTIVYLNNASLTQNANAIHTKLSQKTGVEAFVTYTEPEEILEAVDKILNRQK